MAETAQPLPARIEAPALAPGLWLVATPIGAARDITLRALDVLNGADILAAEDTRTLRHLLGIHGVPLRGRPLWAWHDHNETRAADTLVAALAEGRSVAYASEAGTPLVADPGFRLVRAAVAAGAPVHALPGPSAALAALSVSGLPTDRFLFAGFPPAAIGARRRWLDRWLGVDATLVLFESPRRVRETLGILCETEPDRIIVICRELTKRFQEILRGTVAELARQVPEEGLRGELVLVLGPPAVVAPTRDAVAAALDALPAGMTLKDGARQVAAALGLPRRDVYQQALARAAGRPGDPGRQEDGDDDPPA